MASTFIRDMILITQSQFILITQSQFILTEEEIREGLRKFIAVAVKRGNAVAVSARPLPGGIPLLRPLQRRKFTALT